MMRDDENTRPPRLARLIIEKMSMYNDGYECSGDMEEEYSRILDADGKAQADRWYRRQAYASAPRYLALSAYWWFVMFGSYMVATLRNMRRYKGYALLNISGLVLGLACSLSIFVFVLDETGYDRFHENRGRIYQVYSRKEQGAGGSTVYTGSYFPLSRVIGEEVPQVESSTRWGEDEEMVLSDGTGRGIVCRAAYVDDPFFKIFSFPLARGDRNAPFTGRDSIVLTRSMAARLFGNSDVIGKTVRVNNRYDATVTALVDAVPRRSTLKFDCALPFASLFGDKDEPDHWGGNPFATFVMLGDNSGPDAAVPVITEAVRTHRESGAMAENFFLHPLGKLHLFEPGGGGLIRTLVIMIVIALAVLAVACINFINLNTARASTRIREVVMRKILGANREDLVEQFVGEAILISAMALLVSVAAVSWILPVFNRVMGRDLSVGMLLTPPVIAGFLVIMLITGLASGIYPASCLSSVRTSGMVRMGSGTISGNSRLRKTLVVIQFAISIFLMTATFAVYRQLDYMMSKDLGFDSGSVLTVRMSDRMKGEYDVFKARLLKTPGVVSVSSSLQHPVNIGSTVLDTDWPGKDPDRPVTMHWDRVGYDFIETFGMEIVQGRAFSEDFASDEGAAYILNEEAVRQMGVDSPVGMRFSAFKKEGTVVGVVRDFHFQPLYSGIKPFIFMLQPKSRSFLYARVSPETPRAESSIIEACKTFDPDGNFEVMRFADIMRERVYTTEMQMREVAGYFTVFALLIACMGLLGLSAFMAEKRKKEISVRRVLGASTREVAVLFTREFVLWVALAWVIALPGAYFGLRAYLSIYAFHFSPDAALFVIPGAAALLVALASVGVQAFRAAGSDPATVLRNE